VHNKFVGIIIDFRSSSYLYLSTCR